MKRLVAAAVLVAGLFGTVVGPVRAEVTAEQVRKAIDRGVKYLEATAARRRLLDRVIGLSRAASAPCVRWPC